MKSCKYFISITLLILICACSTTRKVEQGEILYNGLKGVDFSTPDGYNLPYGLADNITEAVDVPANKKLFWLVPLGLWTYNNIDSHSSGLKKWFYNKFAEEPIVVSDVRPEVRTKMIDEILDNNGFFRGHSSYELVSGKNPRKAKILYKVTTGNPYLLDSIILPPDNTFLYHIIDSVASRLPYLQKGARFSTDSLAVARTIISNAARNRGYYYFQPQFLEYEADSIMNPGHIALRMLVAYNIPSFAKQRYRTGNVTVIVNRNENEGIPDTICMKRGSLVKFRSSKVRPSAIDNCLSFRKGRYFSASSIDRTQTYLAQLGIFNAIDIDASPAKSTSASDSIPALDVTVNCTLDSPLELSVEANVSSKSNSYLGPGLSIGFTNKNLFGGGEMLSSKLTGTYEWQTGRGRSNSLNSYEVGITESLIFPRLLLPGFIPRRRHGANWTRISLNADLLNRPHYFKIAQFNASISYDWTQNRYASHSLTPFKLTYTKLMHTTAEFDSIMDANPAIALSFKSQFIPQLKYTLYYNRQFNNDNTVNGYVSATEAGNLFWGIWQICGKHGEKKLFGTPFSQFVKAEAQIVYGHRLSGDNWLWSRVQAGAAHAYGNSSQVPYIEQFYCGGANSVRAFAVRSIGPGSYHAPSSMRNGYFDQTGTFIFQFNLEYRFPLYGPLHGALFFDSGNVWLLKNDPQRPGGTLRGSTFFKELATGTGLGLRFDISMIVVRADLGIGIHAPYDTGKSGYYNMESFRKSLALHLAIGYPF